MSQPSDEQIWEGTLHAFMAAVEQSRKSLPHRGLLTMAEEARHDHVREFIGLWHETLGQSPPSRFLTVLLEAQAGPDTTVRTAYREFIAMLLDTLYSEKDEHEECTRALEQTCKRLQKSRRDAVSIRQGVADIAGSMSTIVEGMDVLRKFFGVAPAEATPHGANGEDPQ